MVQRLRYIGYLGLLLTASTQLAASTPSAAAEQAADNDQAHTAIRRLGTWATVGAMTLTGLTSLLGVGPASLAHTGRYIGIGAAAGTTSCLLWPLLDPYDALLGALVVTQHTLLRPGDPGAWRWWQAGHPFSAMGVLAAGAISGVAWQYGYHCIGGTQGSLAYGGLLGTLITTLYGTLPTSDALSAPLCGAVFGIHMGLGVKIVHQVTSIGSRLVQQVMHRLQCGTQGHNSAAGPALGRPAAEEEPPTSTLLTDQGMPKGASQPPASTQAQPAQQEEARATSRGLRLLMLFSVLAASCTHLLVQRKVRSGDTGAAAAQEAPLPTDG